MCTLRKLIGLFVLFTVAATAHAAPVKTVSPTIFAPGVISGSTGSASPAFTPEGNTVYFMRGLRQGWSILKSQRMNGHWSKPAIAVFSGRWRDLDPAMAPDGSFLVFVSNRPAKEGGKPIDAVNQGEIYPGHGMNLWRVNRKGNGWGTPVRLPNTVNRCTMTFAPSIAADGSLYFIGCSKPGAPLRLLRSQYHGGRYLSPTVVAIADKDAQIRDPAIAPDESFIVFSIKKSGGKQPYRLDIAYRDHGHWSRPIDLGNTVNGTSSTMASRLGPPNRRTLYFSRNGNIFYISLAPWLNKPNTP